MDQHEQLVQISQIIGLLLLGYFGIRATIIALYLVYQYMKFKFGSRIAIDSNKAILITGGTSGLGLSLAKHLHKLGFTVIATYYSDKEPGCGELNDISFKAQGDQRLFLLQLDVRSLESIDECHTKVEQILSSSKDGKAAKQLHAVVNNAGCSFDGPFEWTQIDCLRRVIETNLIGCLMMSRKFVNRIILDKGRFVNVSSGIEVVPMKTMSIYGATKAGVAYFSEALDQDLRPYGAASYCILPGNLIHSTNIVFTRLQGTQQSIAGLSEQERTLYSKSIGENLIFYETLAKNRLEDADYATKDIESLYQGLNLEHLNVSTKANETEKSRNCFSTLFCWPFRLFKRLFFLIWQKSIASFSGFAPDDKSLEEVGVLIAFEAALLLKQAPTRIYLGTPFYTYISGPICDLLAPKLLKFFSSAGFKAYYDKTFGGSAA